jgi:hypothetical protein
MSSSSSLLLGSAAISRSTSSLLMVDLSRPNRLNWSFKAFCESYLYLGCILNTQSELRMSIEVHERN